MKGLQPALKGLLPALKGLLPALKGLQPALKGLQPASLYTPLVIPIDWTTTTRRGRAQLGDRLLNTARSRHGAQAVGHGP